MLSPHSSGLVIGCGYLGRRVAEAWRGVGRPVAALTRGRAEELAAVGIEPITGDILDPASLRDLPPAKTVLYAVGMDRSAGRSMRDVYVDGLANVLDAIPRCERFLYISSTGVYGQTDGSYVDESSPTEPVEESGRVIREAEQLLQARRPGAILLRFAGIYGPGRILRRDAVLAGEPLVGDADKWLNLVHVVDGARAVQAAEECGQPGETYLVADGNPVRRRDFYTHLAQLLGAPAARFEPKHASYEPNRRVSAAKLRDKLGFVPQYPSYIEGLASSVQPRRSGPGFAQTRQ